MTDIKNIVSFPDIKAIEKQAAVWIARMDTHELSSSDLVEFQAWVKASIQHREAVDRMVAIWGGSDILEQLNYLDELDKHAFYGFSVSRITAWTISVAAMLFLVISSVLLVRGGYFLSQEEAQYATSIGQQKTILFADGSTAILNTNSEINVSINKENRIVRLMRGEAHFEVAHESQRPFLVYAGDGVVKAVGTAFSVHVRGKAVEVTVNEGVVEYLKPEGPFQRSMDSSRIGNIAGASGVAKNLTSSETYLVPVKNLHSVAALTVGQSAIFSEVVEKVQKMSKQALDRKLLWREGFIAFAGEPLAVVVDDISRYTDIKIEIKGSDLEALPIGGYFRVGDIEGMFEALENAFGVEVVRLGPKKALLTRAG